MTDLNFDFSQVNPIFEGSSFLPVSPAQGWLVILVADNGWKQSKSNGNNWFLELAGKGQEGPVANQDFVLRFNLKNDNPKAVNAAAQELAALGHVLGLPGKIGNTAELFNRPFRVISEQQKDDKGQPTAFTQIATNGIRDSNGNMAGKAGAGPQTAAPAPQGPAPTGPAPFQPQGGFSGAPQGNNGGPANNPAPFAGPQGGSPFPGPGPAGGGAPSWAQGPGR